MTEDPRETASSGHTGRALADHWQWAADKGLMNRNTANARKAACMQVLGVLDNWETADISSIDVEDILRRFENLRRQKFAPKSLAVYKSRFRRAYSSYNEYLADPSGWKPQQRSSRSGRTSERLTKRPATHETPLLNREDGLVEYPFPLRPGQTARLRLPADLTNADVDRLDAFLRILVIERIDSHRADTSSVVDEDR